MAVAFRVSPETRVFAFVLVLVLVLERKGNSRTTRTIEFRQFSARDYLGKAQKRRKIRFCYCVRTRTR